MDLTALTDGEVVELVLVSQQVAAIARAVHTAAVARLDVTKAFEADGARSAASWAAWVRHLCSPRAARDRPESGARAEVHARHRGSVPRGVLADTPTSGCSHKHRSLRLTTLPSTTAHLGELSPSA